MLDIKEIRKNPEKFKKQLIKRGDKYAHEIDKLIKLDSERRKILTVVEDKKKEKNIISKQIGDLKKNGDDISKVVLETNELTADIKKMSDEVAKIDQETKEIILLMPNIVHDSVPRGTCEIDNEIAKEHGVKKKFDFPLREHYDLAKDLEIIDFEAGTTIAGSRFILLKGLGARLERALISFMLDTHVTQHNYHEFLPPFIVNREVMTMAGKLPKFEEDAFKMSREQDWFLNSTAEVPMVGYFSNRVFKEDDLPYSAVAFATSFRREAGSAGRDTRGLMRLHQFNKVELFKVVKPENSYHELEYMLANSEKILQLLDLPYRVVNLCTGDLGETSTKTYDIEVYLPVKDEYREIASVSNVESFQSMRANTKYRRNNDNRLEYVHFLNGSGLAVGRTMIAIIENYQQEDGSIKIPKVLIPYMGGIEVIK